MNINLTLEDKNNTVNCPKCGGNATRTYNPPYQEYPGASVQDGDFFVECPCGYENIEPADLSNFNYRENTRGW
jgi:hypothetical protein